MRVWTWGHARRAPRHALAACTCALLAMRPAPLAASSAAPPLRAHVAWAGAGRVYVVATDSLSASDGARLMFAQHGRALASARIENVLDGHLIVASDSANIVAKIARPERLQVYLIEAPPPPPSLLRVGIPQDARGNPLVRCGATHPAPPASAGYREEALAPLETRLVRGGGAADWPDTLRVIRFADAADEEIALERGEIDVGVFWPGELSSAMRQSPAWRGFALAPRSRGGLAVADEAGAAGAAGAALAAPAMAALNRDVFRGDLWLTVRADSSASAGVRFVVDDSIPGHARIERALDSYAGGKAGAGRTLSVVAADSLIAEGVHAPSAVVLRMRCAVVCAAGWRDLVHRLGGEAFADLPGCGPRAAP